MAAIVTFFTPDSTQRQSRTPVRGLGCDYTAGLWYELLPLAFVYQSDWYQTKYQTIVYQSGPNLWGQS